MAKPYLSVIIPAYNEAEHIAETLIDIDRHLSKKKYSYEILVVNDGSKDKTAEIVTKMSKTIKGLKLSDFSINRGKASVVRDGMLMAKGKYRLFMDADNSTTVDHFDHMVTYFSPKEGYDIVITSRAHKESKLEPAQPFFRKLPGKFGNLIIQALILPGLWDTQCGFKAFTEEVVEKIFPKAKIKGWGFDAELLALAKKYRFRIKEIPVHWVNVLDSRVTLKGYIHVLWEVVKIRWFLWVGAYKN